MTESYRLEMQSKLEYDNLRHFHRLKFFNKLLNRPKIIDLIVSLKCNFRLLLNERFRCANSQLLRLKVPYPNEPAKNLKKVS